MPGNRRARVQHVAERELVGDEQERQEGGEARERPPPREAKPEVQRGHQPEEGERVVVVTHEAVLELGKAEEAHGHDGGEPA